MKLGIRKSSDGVELKRRAFNSALYIERIEGEALTLKAFSDSNHRKSVVYGRQIPYSAFHKDILFLLTLKQKSTRNTNIFYLFSQHRAFSDREI